MKRFTLSPDAAQDLDEIWEYVAEDSSNAADRLLGRLQENIRRLARMPGMGHLRNDLTPLPLLFWPVDPYVVLYRQIKDSIEVIAIVHGSRDIPRFVRQRFGGKQ